MPEVSIIVPVYKVEKYLPRCIDSILSQTFRDFELILIDDGSPDKSGAICDAYASKDERVKIIHKENGGVSAARNTGIDAASGKYIMFVDSDDWIAETMLAEMLPYMDDTHDLVFSEITMVSDDGEQCFSMEEKSYSCKELIEAYCLRCFPIINICGPWAKIFRKEIIDKNQIYFDTSLHNGEDTYFTFTYLRYCKGIQTLNKTFYMYMRDNEESLFSKVREFTYSNTCSVFFYIKELAERYHCDNRAIENLIYDHIKRTIILLNKALMTADKALFFQLMKEIAENKFFTEKINRLWTSPQYYIIAWLLKHHCFKLTYTICLLWRTIRDFM